MLVEVTAVVMFYPLTAVLYYVYGAKTPIMQFFFVGVYSIFLVVTALLMWLGFKKIESDHKVIIVPLSFILIISFMTKHFAL